MICALRLVDMLPCQMKPTLIRAPPVINGYSTTQSATDVKNVAQYEAVFLQLADEHRTVNTFELHELLEACLPNGKNPDYWSRNIVASFQLLFFWQIISRAVPTWKSVANSYSFSM